MEKFKSIVGFEDKRAESVNNIMYIKSSSVVDEQGLTRLLNMYATNTVSIDKDMIDDDIRKLQKNIDNTKNKMYIKSANEIIQYLHKLKKYGNGEMKLKLVSTEKSILGLPNHLYRFPDFNIQSTDYVSVQDKAIVSVKYDNMLDALALVICREDLGISIDDIEKSMHSLGMVSTYSNEELKKFMSETEGRELKDGSLYNMCMSLRVGSSDYMSLDNGVIYDFFGNVSSLEDNKVYNGVLERSAGIVMKLITLEMLKQLNDCYFGYRLISVNDGLMTFTLDKSVDINDASKMLNLEVVLTVFGRKFKFAPDIKISKLNS